MGFQFLRNNKDAFINASDEAIERALEIIGLNCENYARNNAPVVSGFLKNSITSAVGGKSTTIANYKADVGDKTGSYSGTVPANKEPYVVIGTNVEYAKYVEFNSKKKPQGYLRPALSDHFDEFKQIMENELQNG